MSQKSSVSKNATIPTNTVQLVLGKEEFLMPLFDFYGELGLLEAMEHAFSMTLLRDQFPAGWAHVWKDKSDNLYHLKITTPNRKDNVLGYAELIPRYLAAVDVARRAFDHGLAIPATRSIKEVQAMNLRFLPPFGLSMLNAKSVLLLHYPPDETLDYKDYLHSRTTRRWESLLISNGHPGNENPLLESIVDVFPVTADGGSVGSKAVDDFCKPLQKTLATYANQLLSLLLQQEDVPDAKVTQPLVALGSKVRDWLFNDDKLRTQIENQLGKLGKASDLKILSVFNLEFEKGIRTPVLIVDHPCNYYRGMAGLRKKIDEAGTDKAKRLEAEQKLAAMQESQLKKDLIGARWQVKMSENAAADPEETLKAAKAYWNSPDNQVLFQQVAEDQVIQFQNIAEPELC